MRKLSPLSWVVLVACLPLLAFFLRLGAAPLFDVDEGAFSRATLEMFERGDFLFTYLNGEPRFDKPILVYWFQAVGYHVFGLSEWAFRLPSAISAALWCYAVWHFARPRWGAECAWIALAVSATALGPFVIGRAATADGLLNLLIALSMFDAWRHLETGRRAPLLRSFLWIGLGILTKGPIAFLIPGAVTFLYCASKRQWRVWFKAVFDPLGWIILLGVAAPWYGVALMLHGWDFIDGFILKHNVERFSGTIHGHAGGLFYYVFMVPALLLPWAGPLLASLKQIKPDFGQDLPRFLWLWAAFVIGFFSLSGTKLPHYVLYGSTPLFLLIAAHRHLLRRPWAHLSAPTMVLALIPLLPLIFVWLSASDAGNAFFRAHLALAAERAGMLFYVVSVCGLLLWLTTITLWRAPLHRKLVVAGALQVIVLSLVVTPWFGAVLQAPVRNAALVARALDEPVVAMRLHAPSFSVYRLAVTPSGTPEPGGLALTRIDRIPPEGYQVVFSEGGVALVRRWLETSDAPQH